MKKTPIAFVLAAMIVLASCTEQGAVLSGLQVDMKATTSTSKISSGRTQATALTFEKAMLGVHEFEFETEDEDESESHHNKGSDDDDEDDDNSGSSNEDDDDNSGSGKDEDDDDDSGEDDSEEVEFRGSFVVDLIKGTSDPELTGGDLVPGTYHKFEVELAPVLPDGNSLSIVFKYKPTTGDSVTVEISTKARLEFEFRDDAGFEIKDETLTNFLVLIDLDKLVAGIDLTAAVASDDGVVRINDTTNTALLKSLKAKLDDSCRGGRDDDRDEDIDDDND